MCVLSASCSTPYFAPLLFFQKVCVDVWLVVLCFLVSVCSSSTPYIPPPILVSVCFLCRCFSCICVFLCFLLLCVVFPLLIFLCVCLYLCVFVIVCLCLSVCCSSTPYLLLLFSASAALFSSQPPPPALQPLIILSTAQMHKCTIEHNFAVAKSQL